MCSTSAIMDYGSSSPDFQRHLQQPFNPFHAPKTDNEAVDAIKRFIKLVDAARDFDRAAGEPDCEDPKKFEFMQQVLDRLTAIEKRLGDTK